MSFKKLAVGTAMMSSVRVVRLLAQFVAIPILSRLLTPAEYGLVAIAMPFVLFAMMIADAGIGMSLLRTLATDRLAWSTSFWLSTLLGLGLGLVMAALGPLAAWLFHEPQLTGMLAALSLVVMAQAIHLIPAAYLQKHARFKAIAGIDIAATFSGLGTALYMAYHGYGAWALVGQQIAFFAIRVALSFWLSGFRPMRIFSWSHVKEHVNFGRNVLGNSLVNYFARSFDNWVVGKVLGSTLLGFYSMAFLFARLPAMMVTGPLQYAVYGQLAKMKHDTAAMARAYLLITRLLSALIFPALGMAAVAHTPVFSVLLSDKWAQAGLIFMFLAPACALQAVIAISETFVFALGHTSVQLRTSVEYSVLWILALMAAVSFGLNAAVITYSIIAIVYQIRYLSVVLPLLQLRFTQYFSTLIVPLATTTIAIGIYEALRQAVDMGQWAMIGVCAMLGGSAVLVNILSRKRGLREEIRALDFGYQPEQPVDNSI